MLIGFSITANASTADIFQLDETKVSTELADLTEMETYVEANLGITQSDLEKEGQFLAANLNANTTDAFANAYTLDDMDWGSFAWGFCCWPVGLFVVAFNTEKTQDQKTSFWIGTVVGIVAGGIGGLASAL